MRVGWGLMMMCVLGCATPAEPSDAGSASSDVGTDAGLSTCPGAHAIAIAPEDAVSVLGARPRYPSPTRFDQVGASPVDPDGVLALVEPTSGDFFGWGGSATLRRFTRAGQSSWSTSASVRGPLQLDVTTGRLLGLGETDELVVVDALTGRSTSVPWTDAFSATFAPDGRIVATTREPCDLAVFDGSTEQARVHVGDRCGVVAITCDLAWVEARTGALAERMVVRLADLGVGWRAPLEPSALGETLRSDGSLLVVTSTTRVDGSIEWGFERIGLDGTVTRLGSLRSSVPPTTLAFATDSLGTDFVRIDRSVVRIDAAGAMSSILLDVAPTEGPDAIGALVLTTDGELLVSTGASEGSEGMGRTLRFLSADTLDVRRSVLLDFDACGAPVLGPRGTLYVPACDGSIHVIGPS